MVGRCLDKIYNVQISCKEIGDLAQLCPGEAEIVVWPTIMIVALNRFFIWMERLYTVLQHGARLTKARMHFLLGQHEPDHDRNCLPYPLAHQLLNLQMASRKTCRDLQPLESERVPQSLFYLSQQQKLEIQVFPLFTVCLSSSQTKVVNSRNLTQNSFS